MNKHLIYVAVLLLLFLVSHVEPVDAEMTGVSYVVAYDVVGNTGLMTIYVNVTATECTILRVPANVFNDREVSIEYLNYTAVGVTVFGLDLREGIVEIGACGSGTLELVFAVSDLMEELGAGAYSLVVDTSALAGMRTVLFELRLGIPASLEVQASGETRVEVRDEDRGVLILRGPGLALVSIITLTPEPVVEEQPQPAIPITYIAILVVIVALAAAAVVVFLKRRK